MTLKELYETIKQKKENAEYHYNRMIIEEKEGKEVKATRLILKGEIEAYTDVLCLIESSGEIDDK